MYLNFFPYFLKAKPSIIKFPAVTSVDVLFNISIPCLALGTPTPVIRWLFVNGSVVTTSPKLSVTSRGDLQILGMYDFLK